MHLTFEVTFLNAWTIEMSTTCVTGRNFRSQQRKTESAISIGLFQIEYDTIRYRQPSVKAFDFENFIRLKQTIYMLSLSKP